MEQIEKIKVEQKKETKAKIKLWDVDLIKKIILCILAGFLSRATIGSFNPIGIAYFAGIYKNKSTRILAAVGTILGIATKMNLLDGTKYSLTILMIICIVSVFEGKKKIANKVTIATVAGLSILILGVASAAVQLNSRVLYQLAIVEGLTVIALSLVFSRGIDYLLNRDEDRNLSNEDVISIVLLGVSLLIGISDMVFLKLPIYEIAAYLLTLIMCYRYGIGAGAASGIITSFVLANLGLLSYDTITIMAISAVVASIFSEIGKIPCAVAYLMTTIITSNYSLGLTIDYEMIRSLLTAEVIFITMPKGLTRRINSKVADTGGTIGHLEKIQANTIDKLKGFAACFNKLGTTFYSLAERRNALNKTEVGQILDELANKVCGSCSLCESCWKREFYETYKAAYSILGSAEKNGKVKAGDIPMDFQIKCVKLDEFITTTNSIFEIFKNNLVWNNRMAEGRELIAEQLIGVSKVIESFSEQLGEDMEGNRFLEKRLDRELKRSQINIEDILIIQKYSKRKEIHITINTKKVKKEFMNQMLEIICDVLNKPFELDEKIVNQDNPDEISLKYIETKQFNTAMGIAKACKDGNTCSGDNYTVIELDSGQTLYAISDGMGSGEKAAKESEAAIKLLEQFMEAGFDRETAIKMINSILVLKSSEQSFTTLDLSIIDLYSGECEIVKVGASSTFIKRGKTVEVLRSTNLPIGVLNEMELDEATVDLSDSDLVIMVTDGVLDADRNFEKEHFIKNILESHSGSSPQKIADEILSFAKKKVGEKIRDDMTVLVAKVAKI